MSGTNYNDNTTYGEGNRGDANYLDSNTTRTGTNTTGTTGGSMLDKAKNAVGLGGSTTGTDAYNQQGSNTGSGLGTSGQGLNRDPDLIGSEKAGTGAYGTTGTGSSGLGSTGLGSTGTGHHGLGSNTDTYGSTGTGVGSNTLGSNTDTYGSTGTGSTGLGSNTNTYGTSGTGVGSNTDTYGSTGTTGTTGSGGLLDKAKNAVGLGGATTGSNTGNYGSTGTGVGSNTDTYGTTGTTGTTTGTGHHHHHGHHGEAGVLAAESGVLGSRSNIGTGSGIGNNTSDFVDQPLGATKNFDHFANPAADGTRTVEEFTSGVTGGALTGHHHGHHGHHDHHSTTTTGTQDSSTSGLTGTSVYDQRTGNAPTTGTHHHTGAETAAAVGTGIAVAEGAHHHHDSKTARVEQEFDSAGNRNPLFGNTNAGTFGSTGAAGAGGYNASGPDGERSTTGVKGKLDRDIDTYGEEAVREPSTLDKVKAKVGLGHSTHTTTDTTGQRNL